MASLTTTTSDSCSTNVNALYRSTFECNWDDERKSLRDLRQCIQSQHNEIVRNEQKKRQPRKRVHFDPLPKDMEQRLITNTQSSPVWMEMKRLERQIEWERESRERLLERMAPQVELQPVDEMHRLQTSSSYSYHTQGYGAMQYARGSLEPALDMLEQHGFTGEIRATNRRRGEGQFAIDHCDFELWANCPAWMFDAMWRQLTLQDAVDSMKRRQLNPFVYLPGLPMRYAL